MSGASVSGGASTVHSCIGRRARRRAATCWSPGPRTCTRRRRPRRSVTGELHGAIGAPFSEHSNVEPAWSDENSNVATVSLVVAAGAASIVVSGGPITNHVNEAGVGSGLSDRSTARIRDGVRSARRGPARRAASRTPPTAPSSSEHSNATSSAGVALSVPVNSNVASVSIVEAGGVDRQRRLGRRSSRPSSSTRGARASDRRCPRSTARGRVGVVDRAHLEHVRAGRSSRAGTRRAGCG